MSVEVICHYPLRLHLIFTIIMVYYFILEAAMEQSHPFPPIYDSQSRLLILGTFPSVKSRENGFFYGHPQNRFWKVTAEVFGCPVPVTIEEKQIFLHQNHIALWDVIDACSIENSADSSIKNVVANELSPLLQHSKITRVFTNGKTAQALYDRHLAHKTKLPAHCLPSTSPANAAWSLEKLVEAWGILRL